MKSKARKKARKKGAKKRREKKARKKGAKKRREKKARKKARGAKKRREARRLDYLNTQPLSSFLVSSEGQSKANRRHFYHFLWIIYISKSWPARLDSSCIRFVLCFIHVKFCESTLQFAIQYTTKFSAL